MNNLTDAELAELRYRIETALDNGRTVVDGELTLRLITEVEVRRLLESPETPEEKFELDKLMQDSNKVLQRVLERTLLRQARRRAEKLDEPPKL